MHFSQLKNSYFANKTNVKNYIKFAANLCKFVDKNIKIKIYEFEENRSYCDLTIN